MTTLILMPDGNALSPDLIRQVSLHKRGVLCRDAQQRMIAWIPVVDEVKGKRVRDILIRLTADGPRPIQPDWSFLNEEADAS
jgi:hypothetical protein